MTSTGERESDNLVHCRSTPVAVVVEEWRLIPDGLKMKLFTIYGPLPRTLGVSLPGLLPRGVLTRVSLLQYL